MATKLRDKDDSYFDLEPIERTWLLTGLTRAQGVIHRWRQYNFPEADATQQALGVAEETGELCHAHLKMIQGIREAAEEGGTLELERDAVGDILIYLMGYCSYRNLDIGLCLHEAWEECKKRDWVKYPYNGKDK